MDARIIIGVAMWFVAWTTMLGGLGAAFTLPRDHREDVRVSFRAKAEEKWIAEQAAKRLAAPIVEAKAEPSAQEPDNESEKNSEPEDEVAVFTFHMTEKNLAEAVHASVEYAHIQAQARVAMIIGIVGAVFFVVLVTMAALKEHKQRIEEEQLESSNSDANEQLQTTGSVTK